MKKTVMLFVILMMTLNFYAQSSGFSASRGGMIVVTTDAKLSNSYEFRSCIGNSTDEKTLILTNSKGVLSYEKTFIGNVTSLDCPTTLCGTYTLTLIVNDCSESVSIDIP